MRIASAGASVPCVQRSGMVEPVVTMAEKNQDTAPLPKEILTEILSLLPAKSAGRFRCVSREWSTMLSSAYFVDLHARRANKSGHPRLILAPAGSNDDDYIYSWQPGGQVEKLMPDDFRVGYPLPITKPCHGLILIQCTGFGGYFVCNPSTSTVLPLPDSEAPLKMAMRYSVRNQPEPPFFCTVAYGLGYCSMTKEYKAVRFFNGDGESSCEVFVLDTPAYWRPTAKPPPPCHLKEQTAVFLNGHLHFLCHGAGIITFNISSETFGLLPPLPHFQNASPVLTELDGCLCLCDGDPDPDADGPYHVFLLRDYIEGPWEMFCSIDRTVWPESERMLLRSLCIAPLGMYHTADGRKKIMFGTGACKVFVVDPDWETPEILFTPDGTIIGSCEDDYYLPLGLYEEHLGSVGRTLEEMVLSSPTTKAWLDILKWMPARSVSDLSLVCREWRAMITTDCFIQSHVLHANLNKSPRIMIIIDSRFGHYMDLKDFADAGLTALHQSVECFQPCHGLNLGRAGSSYFICNPCMGYIVFDDNNETFFAGCIGLGYNSDVSKHLLVHIAYKEKNLDTRDYELLCKWRYVKEKQWHSIDPPPRPIADMPATYVNGKIYWVVEPNLGPIFVKCEIIAFNVEAHEFEVLEGPPCSHDNGRLSILQLQGALCVACSVKSMNVIDIWMMKDADTWVMEYHIDLEEFSPEYLSENTTPLAVDPKDGRILLNTGLSLGYYDPKTVALETIYSVGMPDHDCKFCPIISEESLVCPLGPF